MPTGWQGSDRRRRLPPDWETLRSIVLKREHYRCQHIREDTGLKCGRRATEVDHKVEKADDDRPEAMQALCSWHHLRKTGRAGGIASGKSKRARAATEKPMHPGLLAERPRPDVAPPF